MTAWQRMDSTPRWTGVATSGLGNRPDHTGRNLSGLDVLYHELALPHEWHLGCGRNLSWRPKLPAQIDRPGFRDEGAYRGLVLAPVFAVSVLDDRGRLLPLHAASRNWNPARLELCYDHAGCEFIERRTILANDTFVSHWTLSHCHATPRRFWFVLWTRRPDGFDGRELADIEANPRAVSFLETQRSLDGACHRLACALGGSLDAESWSVSGADSPGLDLEWDHTPFGDGFGPSGLPGRAAAPLPQPGYLFVAQAFLITVPVGERVSASLAAAVAPDIEVARTHLEQTVSLVHPIQVSEEDWITWFEDVPSFACSDRRLQRLYWYRWSQRRLWQSELRCDATAGQAPIVDDRLAAAVELAWHHDAAHALEMLERAAPACQKPQPFGLASRRVFALHTDHELLPSLWHLAKMASCDATTAPDHGSRPPSSSLPGETIADLVFEHDTQWWRCRLAAWLDRTRPADHECLADLARQLDALWDDERKFFVESQVAGHPRRKTAFGFLPLLTPYVTLPRRSSLAEHLFDPEGFWTKALIPSLSRDDAAFDGEAPWTDHRCDAPRQARSWPALNSLVIEGFGRQIESASATERCLFVRLLERTLALPFGDSTDDVPAFYPHYHPMTGRPAAYLGRSAPLGDWPVDHILRFVAGVRPDENGVLLIDPLPMGLEWFSVGRLFVGDHEIEITWDQRSGLQVRIDDHWAGQAPIGKALSILLPSPLADAA